MAYIEPPKFRDAGTIGAAGTIPTTLSPTSSPVVAELQSEVLSVQPYDALSLRPYPSGVYQRAEYSLGAAGSTIEINGIRYTQSFTPVGANQYNSVLELASLINSNPALNGILSATGFIPLFISTVQLLLQAKQAGVETFSAVLVGGNTSFNILSITDGIDVTRADTLRQREYRHYIQVVRRDRAGYVNNPRITGTTADKTPSVTLVAVPDAQGVTRIDVSEAMRQGSEVQRHTGISMYHPNAIWEYQLNYGEQHNGGRDLNTGLPIDDSTFVRSYEIGQAVIHAIDGALIEGEDYIGYYRSVNQAPSASETLETVKPLSRAPEYLMRTRDDLTYPLYFVCLRTGAVTREVNYMLEDGTTGSLAAQPIGEVNASNRGLYSINTGFNALGLQAVEQATGMRVLTYEVVGLVDGVILVSQTYEVDSNLETLYQKSLSFKNSLGVYETLSIQSPQQDETRADTVPYRSGNIRKIYTVDRDQRIRVSTGWLPASHYDWLRDVVGSVDTELDGVKVVISGSTLARDEEQGYVRLELILEPKFIERSLRS